MIKKPYNEDGTIRYFELFKIMLFISFLMALFVDNFSAPIVSSTVPAMVLLNCLVVLQVSLLVTDELKIHKAFFVALKDRISSLINRVFSFLYTVTITVKVEVTYVVVYIRKELNKLFLVNNVIRC